MKKFSLSRTERIKRKKDFERIYNSPKIVFSKDFLLKSYFFILERTEKPGVKFAAAVSKNAGKAVWRNRVKRLLKESYRLNKQELCKKTIEKNMLLFIIISPSRLSETNKKKIYLRDISSSVVDLLEKIEQKI